MGSRFRTSNRGDAVILLSLSGLLFSCGHLNKSAGDAAMAAAPDAPHIEVADNFSAADLETRFEQVARRVAPTVVAITATDAHFDAENTLRADSITPEKLAALLDPVDRTVGTGFIIDADGYILTNDHVVAGNDSIWVTSDDHHVYPAIVVGSDPRADLAILKVPAARLPVCQLAPAPARRGQWALALGNPYGLAAGGEMAVSVGIVSATGRSLPMLSSKEDRLYTDLIQTTAQINPGNSGGPLFDLDGNVIGINSAVILPQKVTNGIGFAIPLTPHIRHVIDDLKQGREIVYGWLGVRVASLTPIERKSLCAGQEGGAKIESVDANSPAAKANVQPGDIITRLDGQAISDSDQFVRLIGQAPVDHPLEAAVLRDGKPLALTLSTTRRPQQQVAVTRESQRLRWRGMTLGPIPTHEESATAAAHPQAGLMVVAIEPQSPFVKQGISQGAIIGSVAGKPVESIIQLQQILNDTAPADCNVSLAKTSVVSAQ